MHTEMLLNPIFFDIFDSVRIFLQTKIWWEEHCCISTKILKLENDIISCSEKPIYYWKLVYSGIIRVLVFVRFSEKFLEAVKCLCVSV